MKNVYDYLMEICNQTGAVLNYVNFFMLNTDPDSTSMQRTLHTQKHAFNDSYEEFISNGNFQTDTCYCQIS